MYEIFTFFSMKVFERRIFYGKFPEFVFVFEIYVLDVRVKKINNNIIVIDPSQCTGLQQVHAAQALLHTHT